MSPIFECRLKPIIQPSSIHWIIVRIEADNLSQCMLDLDKLFPDYDCEIIIEGFVERFVEKEPKSDISGNHMLGGD